MRGSQPAAPSDVVVVIPCRNAGATLGDQLESLARQQCAESWTVVIADNGSTDDTIEVAAAFAGQLPGLRVIDASGCRGRSHAVNEAVRQTDANKIVIIDGDDVLGPGFLTAMVRALDTADMVGACLDEHSLNPPHLHRRRAPMQVDGLPVLMRYLPFVIGAASAIRRVAFESVGGFDERLTHLQDVDLSWRVQQAGFSVAFVPEATVRYRFRSSSSSLWRQERGYGEYEALLYKLHRPRGVPRRRLRSSVKGWLLVVAALPRAASRAGRARLVTVTGAAWGRLRGSFRHRVLYL